VITNIIIIKQIRWYFEEKVYIVIVNNSSNINKTNNYLSP